MTTYNASNNTFTLYNPWGFDQPPAGLTWAEIMATTDMFTVASTSGSLPISTPVKSGIVPAAAAPAGQAAASLLISAGMFDSGGSGQAFAKSGPGLVILTGSNTYTGATTISGGTLQLGTGQAGSIGSTSGVVNNAALAYNIAGAQTAAYAIDGSGSIAGIGPGLVVLSGSNSYTGGTYLGGAGGTLQLNNANALGSAAAR